MMNYIWLGMMWLSVLAAFWNNKLPEVSLAVTEGIRASMEMLIGISGIIIFWSGLMAIAEKSGLVEKLSRLIYPLLKYLFPNIPKDHPAIGAITMVVSANALGLSNAATPLGLRAMTALSTLNPNADEASDEMCMLVTLNASSLQLIPASTIGFLALYGCDNPTALIFPATFATIISTVAGVSSVLLARRFYRVKKVTL